MKILLFKHKRFKVKYRITEINYYRRETRSNRISRNHVRWKR